MTKWGCCWGGASARSERPIFGSTAAPGWARCRAAKEGVRPLKLHCARHTWARMALHAGKSVRWVADQLGHSDPALTLRVYAHAMREISIDYSMFLGASEGVDFPEDAFAQEAREGSPRGSVSRQQHSDRSVT